MTDNISFHRIELERIRFAAVRELRLDFVREAEVRLEIIQNEYRSMLMRLEYEVAGKTLKPIEETVTFKSPATWLDAFRLAFAASWWMLTITRKWQPPQYKTETHTFRVDVKELYPSIRPPNDHLGEKFLVATQRQFNPIVRGYSE